MLGQIVVSGCASGALSELSYHTVSPGVLEDWNILACFVYALVELIAVPPPSVGPESEDDLKIELVGVDLVWVKEWFIVLHCSG